MADAAADILGLVVGPSLLGLLVFIPIGKIITDAQGRIGVQSWWTWCLEPASG